MQRIIDPTGTETFAKEPHLVTISGAAVNACVACNPKFCCILSFAAGQNVNDCFFANIDVFSIDLHRSLEHI